MTFTAVVVSHANPVGLRAILDNLHDQTWPPDETLAYCSGYMYDGLAKIALEYPWVLFHEADDLDDWGHHKRATGLEAASKDWVGFFNDDDSYHQKYLERMLSTAHEFDVDVVYCAWNEQPDCEFKHSRSTAGNFIVKTGLGREAGYPSDRVYENDGNFIERLNTLGARVVKVDDRNPLLYHHNHQGD